MQLLNSWVSQAWSIFLQFWPLSTGSQSSIEFISRLDFFCLSHRLWACHLLFLSSFNSLNLKFMGWLNSYVAWLFCGPVFGIHFFFCLWTRFRSKVTVLMLFGLLEPWQIDGLHPERAIHVVKSVHRTFERLYNITLKQTIRIQMIFAEFEVLRILLGENSSTSVELSAPHMWSEFVFIPVFCFYCCSRSSLACFLCHAMCFPTAVTRLRRFTWELLHPAAMFPAKASHNRFPVCCSVGAFKRSLSSSLATTIPPCASSCLPFTFINGLSSNIYLVSTPSTLPLRNIFAVSLSHFLCSQPARQKNRYAFIFGHIL